MKDSTLGQIADEQIERIDLAQTPDELRAILNTV